MKKIESILGGLMSRYNERVPYVSKITHALVEKGVISQQEDIENDHIAFRTMGVPQLGISSFEKIFLHYGYVPQGDFYFEQKKLNARWYSPPEDYLPRIFVSELRLQDFSQEIQDIILSYTDEVKTDPVDNLNLNNWQEVDEFLHSPLWRTPTLEDYKKLLEISEYAAWVIYNRYYLNHYTISVHNLPNGYNTLEEFNIFLTSIGVALNDSGGVIKKSADGFLLQSSTVSQLFEATFSEGEEYKVSGSYVEFAERRILPEFSDIPKKNIKRKHRRDGFETSNADKIFESTFTSQTKQTK